MFLEKEVDLSSFKGQIRFSSKIISQFWFYSHPRETLLWIREKICETGRSYTISKAGDM